MNSFVTTFRMRQLMPLGRGGMGTTYLGCAKGAGGFERLVAIKRLHDHLQEDVEACTRLLAEAELAGCVHHANVVAVQHVDRDAQGAFLVLDYIDGGSLKELMRAALPGKIPERVVLRLFLDCLAGLHAIHSATDHRGEPLHILHRDISPDNILVGLDGIARLTDFGIARSRRRPALTAPSQLVGKMAFMAPEYVDRGQLGPSLDVYSMGVTLWMLLVGKNPWAGLEEAQLLAILLTLGVPAVPDDAGVSPRLSEIIARACHRNAEERYQTALDFSRALEELSVQHPIAERAEVAEYVGSSFTVKNSERRLKAAQLLQIQSEPPPSRTLADWSDTERRLLPMVQATPLPPVFHQSGSAPATPSRAPNSAGDLEKVLDAKTVSFLDSKTRGARPAPTTPTAPTAPSLPRPRKMSFGKMSVWATVTFLAGSLALFGFKRASQAEPRASTQAVETAVHGSGDVSTTHAVKVASLTLDPSHVAQTQPSLFAQPEVQEAEKGPPAANDVTLAPPKTAARPRNPSRTTPSTPAAPVKKAPAPVSVPAAAPAKESFTSDHAPTEIISRNPYRPDRSAN